MNSDDIWKSRENRAKGTFSFCSLAVNNIGLNFANFAANRSDASLITGAEPPHFWHVEKVKANVPKKFRWSVHWHLCARNNVNL